MISPALLAGMVERSFATRHGINPVGVRVLVVVAPLARVGDIAQDGLSSLGPWDNVLDGKGVRGITRRTATVLATTARPVRHDPLLGGLAHIGTKRQEAA